MPANLAASLVVVLSRTVFIVLGSVALCAAILGAVGFALAGLYALLLPALGPIAAAFAVSGTALSIPVAAMALALASLRRLQTKEPLAKEPLAAEQVAAPDPLAGAKLWVFANPKTAVLGALSFGVTLGAFPELRKTLIDAVDAAINEKRLSAP